MDISVPRLSQHPLQLRIPVPVDPSFLFVSGLCIARRVTKPSSRTQLEHHLFSHQSPVLLGGNGLQPDVLRLLQANSLSLPHDFAHALIDRFRPNFPSLIAHAVCKTRLATVTRTLLAVKDAAALGRA